MKTILFPTDYSESANHALEFAIYMAQQANASLTIFNVYMSPFTDVHMSADTISTIIEDSRIQAEKNINQLKDELLVKHPWLQVKTQIEYGFVGETIVSYANAIKCNYIVMGTHGAKGILDNVVGSSTMGVIEKSTIPVWAIPLHAKIDEIKSITYASDYKGEETPIIREVLDFATIFEAETHVIHIHQEFEPEITSVDKVAEYLKERFKGSKITFRNLNRQDAVEGIEHYIMNQKPDVIALARHDRGFWTGMFHSSVTKHFAHTSKTPILILHKED